MSEIRDSVKSTIGEGACTIAAICEATSLEPQQVYAAVHGLKKDGEIAKGEGGYAIVDADPSEGDAAAEAAEVAERIIAKVKGRKPRGKRATPPPETKPRRKAKKRVAAREPVAAKPHAASGVPRTTPAVVDVEFARFGEYVVLKKNDLVELLRVMRRWSQMIEAMPA